MAVNVQAVLARAGAGYGGAFKGPCCSARSTWRRGAMKTLANGWHAGDFEELGDTWAVSGGSRARTWESTVTGHRSLLFSHCLLTPVIANPPYYIMVCTSEKVICHTDLHASFFDLSISFAFIFSLYIDFFIFSILNNSDTLISPNLYVLGCLYKTSRAM